jgi:flagellar M-ring protein FliF
MEKRIEQLLAPIVGGPNRVIARVNADLDFSQKTIHKEIYDPEGSVIRSEQKTDESSKGTANYESGVPEPAYRGEGFSGTGSTQETSRTTSTTNYEISKEEQQIVAPLGEVRRLSVAVVVDGRYKKNEKGELVYEPLSEQELERIRQLVKNVVGYDQARGDSIEISNLSFGVPEVEEFQGWMEKIAPYFQSIGKPVLNTFIILLFILLVVRPIIMAILKPKVVEEEVEEVEGLPEAEERPALLEELDEETQAAMETQKQIEDQKTLAVQLSTENFDQAFGVIKKWLKEAEEA